MGEQKVIEWDSDGSGYGSCDEDSLAEVHRIVVRQILQKGCHSVLDFGCGHGRLAEHLGKAGCSVSLYDINEELVSLAKERCAAHDNVSVDADLSEIPDDHFDCVVLSVVLVCSSTKEIFEDTLKSAVSKLKPGGLLVIVETHPAFRGEVFSDFQATYASGEPFDYHDEGRAFQVSLKAGDEELRMTDYHYSISTLLNAIVSSGSRVTHVMEPRDLHESRHRNAMKPPYIVIEARKDGSVDSTD